MYFFYLIEQHSKFLLHTLQVLYMCTLCDSTNISCILLVIFAYYIMMHGNMNIRISDFLYLQKR